MRAAFLGTPAAAVPSLTALAEIGEIEVVVTMPDAARGRSKRPQPPPVKVAAREFGFAVAQPDDDATLLSALEGRDLDVAVVVAYGRILRPAVLATTRVGFVNVHFSLLPRWRGAAPVERAILAGDDVTGVSLMVLDEGLDTGPVISVAETEVRGEENAGELTARLAHLGADLLTGALPAFMSGKRDPAPQIDAGATYAPRLTTGEARLDPDDDVATTLRKVRAFNPRPGAWLEADGQRVKVWVASEGSVLVPNGRIVADGSVPVLGVDGGAVVLDVVQPAGKTPTDGASWWHGVRAPALEVGSAS